MPYCLNSEELRQLIDLIAAGSTIDDAYLLDFIHQSEDWQLELNALTYLFSRVLHNKAKDGWDCAGLIKLFYNLGDRMFFNIEECDFHFIDFVLRNTRRNNLALEDELVDFENRLREHKYEQTLHY